MTVSPEILAEQVMGYVVGADELIPTLNPSSQAYDIAILPQGPHFYTGLLQAAGYLLLDSQKKRMIVISEQSDDSQEILVDSNGYGPVFGQSRKNSLSAIALVAHQLEGKLSNPEQKSLLDNLRFQLPFLRVITDTEEILHISIGKEIGQAKIKRLVTRIKHRIHDHNIVLLTNIELKKTGTKKDEQSQIAASIDQPNTPLVNIFQKILGMTKKKPEIIAYVNPSDFGMESSIATRYVCVMG